MRSPSWVQCLSFRVQIKDGDWSREQKQSFSLVLFVYKQCGLRWIPGRKIFFCWHTRNLNIVAGINIGTNLHVSRQGLVVFVDYRLSSYYLKAFIFELLMVIFAHLAVWQEICTPIKNMFPHDIQISCMSTKENFPPRDPPINPVSGSLSSLNVGRDNFLIDMTIFLKPQF